MIQLCPGSVPVTQALQFMLEVEDEPDWLTSDSADEEEENMRWVWLLWPWLM